MLTDKYISIVVVCYRDEGSIWELLRRVTLIMENITPNWEIIYVNDSSPDNSEKILLEQAVKNSLSSIELTGAAQNPAITSSSSSSGKGSGLSISLLVIKIDAPLSGACLLLNAAMSLGVAVIIGVN